MKRSALALALLLCACTSNKTALGASNTALNSYTTAPYAKKTAFSPNETALDADFHPTERDWGPVWSDEFDDPSVTAPESRNWVIAQYCGGSNQEQQCYRPENITVVDGHLVITAKPETCSGDPFKTAAEANEVGREVACPGNGSEERSFSSGRLHTRVDQSPGGRHAWRYGRIEIRARLPYGTGTWPAFWMMPHGSKYGGWPQSGEIDILETVNLRSPNQKGDRIEANIHLCSKPGAYTPNPPSGNPNPHPCHQLRTTKADDSYDQAHSPKKLLLSSDGGGCWPNLSRVFHTYSLEWSDLDMRFYLDDRLIHTVAIAPDELGVAPFREPFYLIINLAVGGAMTGGTPTPTEVKNSWFDGAASPRAELVVDWVRVYKCETDPTAKKCIYEGAGLGQKPKPIGICVPRYFDD